MIIDREGNYTQHSDYPNENFGGAGCYIIDETTEQGKQMTNQYIDNYPFVDFEHDGEFITKVIVLDKPERPPEIKGKSIELIKNEQGEWEYVYEDVPLTEVEILKKELEEQKALINAILGVTE